MRTSHSSRGGIVNDADQRQCEVSGSLPEIVPVETRRAHDPQRILEVLIANRNDVIATFRAQFAAHHLDVTLYSDDEICQAICTDLGIGAALASHERLVHIFERLQSGL
jgi:hypothetical protein